MTVPPPRIQPTAVAVAWPLVLLLTARMALGAAYSLVVPIWEAFDEDGHFAYVRYLAVYRRLLQPGDPEAEAVYEKFQPPLYYTLVAPFLLGFDLGEAQPIIERNPFWNYAYAGRNYALHRPQLEGAEAEIALAVRTARLVGVVLSSLSVLPIHYVARRVWPRHRGPAWTATLLYAFWPQFLFIGSVITNDLAVTALSAGVLALAVQLVTDGFRPRRALALALLFGMAALSKVTALALLPVVAAATAISLAPVLPRARWRSPLPWLVPLASVGMVGGVLAVLSQLPYVHQHILRVEVLTEFLTQLFGKEKSLDVVLEVMPFTFRSFFALFGWGRVDLHPWLYPVWLAALALGVLGLVVGARRRWRNGRQGPDSRLMLLMGLLVFSLLAAAMALVVAFQKPELAPGRYLLPALPAVCLLLMEGYRGLLPRRAQHFTWRALGLGVVVLGWAIPLLTIIPTYAIPQPLRGAIDVPTTYTFGEAISLIGYQTPKPARPGQYAEVSVCWQATAPVAANYTALLEVFGPDGETYGRLVTYPGRGNFPTHFWAPGVPFCDRYDVLIDPGMPAPAQAWLHLALVSTTFINGDIIRGTRLAVIEPDGQRSRLDAFVLPLKIEAASRPPGTEQPLDYRFGDAMRLRGYSLAVEPATRSVRVTFQWQALRDLTDDYVIFVHLRDTPQSAYAQADSPPRAGWYPTHLWRKGEVVEDTHSMTLPAGTAPPLSLYVGVVQPSLDARLSAVNPAGRRLLNDELVLLKDWVLGQSWSLPDSLTPPKIEATPAP